MADQSNLPHHGQEPKGWLEKEAGLAQNSKNVFQVSHLLLFPINSIKSDSIKEFIEWTGTLHLLPTSPLAGVQTHSL